MKRYFTTMLFLFLFSSINVFAVDELKAKDIVVVPIKKTEPYIEYLHTHKKKYKVGEPIKFILKLKKNAYIYIVNISKRNHHAYKILPNKYQKYNYYKANIRYVVPSKSDPYHLIPDSVGEEIVYVIASEKRIDNLPSFEKFKLKGSIFEEASEREAEEFMKDIKVIPKEQNKMEIRKIIIPVSSKLKTQIFISTDKYVYSTGEDIPILVKKNFNKDVQIFLYNESGKLKKIKTIKKKNTQFSLKLNKDGFYKIMAIYLPKNANIKCLENNLNSEYTKPIKCAKSSVYNIHTFWVKGE